MTVLGAGILAALFPILMMAALFVSLAQPLPLPVQVAPGAPIPSAKPRLCDYGIVATHTFRCGTGARIEVDTPQQRVIVPGPVNITFGT